MRNWLVAIALPLALILAMVGTICYLGWKVYPFQEKMLEVERKVNRMSAKSDQGYVRSDDGEEWKLTRMQTLGITGDYVAVYRKQ